MRRIGLTFVLAVAGALGALAGTFFDRTYFAGDVGVYSWTAPTNLAAAPAVGGIYTNAATIWYRLCGTNAAGRTPWATNGIALAGGTESNAVALTWDRRDGVTGYRLERSLNGSTWTQGLGLAASATGYTDTHASNWTAGAVTLTAIPSPVVPWMVSNAVVAATNGTLYGDVSFLHAEPGGVAFVTIGTEGLWNGEFRVNGAIWIEDEDQPASVNSLSSGVGEPLWLNSNGTAQIWTTLTLPSDSVSRTGHVHTASAVTNLGTMAVASTTDFAHVTHLHSGSSVTSAVALATNSLSRYAGAISTTPVVLTNNATLVAYGMPSVGTNRTLSQLWIQLGVTTNSAAVGGFSDVTNFTMEVLGSWSFNGPASGSTVSVPIPLGGAWSSTSFSGYWTYTVQIPTNLTITSATGAAAMPTYPRFSLRYRGPVGATSVTFVVSSEWNP